MKRVNLPLPWFSLTLAFIAMIGSGLGLLASEKDIANSANEFIKSSPYQSGVHEVAQLFHRIFCSQLRHRECTVRVLDAHKKLMTSVPSIETSHEALFSQRIFIAQNQFNPPLTLELSYVPSSGSVLKWFLFGVFFFLLIFSAVLLTFFRSAKRSAEEKLQLEKHLREAESAFVEVTRQAAHDIRSPVLALKVVADSSGQNSSPEGLVLKSAIERISSIADDLLQKGKARELSQSPASSTQQDSAIDLSATLKSIVEEKRIEFNRLANVRINFVDASAGGLRVAFAKSEFQRVLSNLINNAIEALPNETGVVSISLEDDPKLARVTLRDTGIGIPKELLPKLGKKSLTIGKSAGHGLGLSYSMEKIAAAGGEFEIHSELGTGTEIVIKLPRLN